MDYTLVELTEEHIIGYSIRTANDAPDCVQKIGGLWGALMSEENAGKIPHPISEPYTCYGLYYNYDFSDESYEVLVGSASEDQIAPEGMSATTIPAGSYAKFSIHGDCVKAVQEAWNEIWEMDLPRSYIMDFEAYLPTEDMQNADIDIYISLK